MSDSIRIHPKYGLNATMAQCILCREGTDIILGGRFKDKDGNECEAPQYCSVMSPEPCPACRDKYLTLRGVLLFESIKAGVCGDVAVLSDEAFQRIFAIPIPPQQIVRVAVGLLQKIGAV